MTHAAVPFSIVYPGSYFEGVVPQGTHNDLESEDEQLNLRKMKASLSGRANDVEAGRSTIVGDSSALPLSNKSKLAIALNDLAKEWDITVEEFTDIMMEHNATIQARKEECRSIKLAQTLASAD